MPVGLKYSVTTAFGDKPKRKFQEGLLSLGMFYEAFLSHSNILGGDGFPR